MAKDLFGGNTGMLKGSLREHFGPQGRVKRRYKSKESAQAGADARKRREGVTFSVYRCSICHDWHLSTVTDGT